VTGSTVTQADGAMITPGHYARPGGRMIKIRVIISAGAAAPRGGPSDSAVGPPRAVADRETL
jgi:hypothetical protein